MVNSKNGLMTQGSIFKKIFLFSIPLLLGNFFQLMYNTIDSVVVGNYVGKTALAAVGASSPIVSFMIAFFQGLATGAGVVVARAYGSRNRERVEKSVHTFITFSFIFGLILSIVGYFLAGSFLKWINTADDYYLEALAYLKIYFLGNVFVTLYNAGTGILQSVGNSKVPLIILIITSLANIFFDILLVKTFGLGVAGAAYATVICEAISVVLVLLVLFLAKDEYKLEFRKLRIDLESLKQTIKIGVPAGLQGMIVSISNVFVMAYINDFGSAAVAGFSCANKYDNFMALPVNSLALAITTFISQNLGAREYERVKKSTRITIAMALSIVILLSVFLYIFAKDCAKLFSSEEDVINAAAAFIRSMCPFYFALCFHQVYSGALRASGRSNIPMITSIMSFVVIRQIFLYFTLQTIKDIKIVGYSYGFTWILAAVFTSLYYFKSHWLIKEENKSKIA